MQYFPTLDFTNNVLGCLGGDITDEERGLWAWLRAGWGGVIAAHNLTLEHLLSQATRFAAWLREFGGE
jgi:hypothetical protein